MADVRAGAKGDRGAKAGLAGLDPWYMRLAMVVVATPVVCCFVGLGVLLGLRARVAGFVARYAAMGAAPWPGATGAGGEPSTFLHWAEASRDVLVRNPAQWGMAVGMNSFFTVPLLGVCLAAIGFCLATRRWSMAYAVLPPMLVLVWMGGSPLWMILTGRELVLDGAANSLTLNGRRLAALTDVSDFAGVETHSAKGEASFHLVAVLGTGKTIELEGPDAGADVVEGGAGLDAMFVRLLAGRRPARPPGVADCPGTDCPGTTVEDVRRAKEGVLGVMGAAPQR